MTEHFAYYVCTVQDPSPSLPADPPAPHLHGNHQGELLFVRQGVCLAEIRLRHVERTSLYHALHHLPAVRL